MLKFITMFLFKIKDRRNLKLKSYVGVKTSSTVYPLKGRSNWYGMDSEREEIKNVFEKL